MDKEKLKAYGVDYENAVKRLREMKLYMKDF